MTIGISLLFTFSCTWCLYNLLLGETFEVPCEAEWTLSPYSGTCLKLFHEKGSWKRAKDFCQSQNAALLKVIDSKMNNYVLNILPGQDPYYIGLILDDEKRKLVWLNEDEEAGYAAFERRKTMLIKGTMCGVVSKQQGRVDLLWDVVDCASPQQFLCLKRPSNGTCSTGWTYVKDDDEEEYTNNYEFCFDFEKSNQMLSWEDARQSCKQKDADLAKIYTYSLDRLIHDFLSHNESQRFYIGLKVNNTEPRWLDEQESAENYYLNFAPGQINKGGSLCGQLNNQSVPRGEWALVNCESSHKFICEIDKGLCPYGWIPSASSGTCIKIYHHTPVTESQAVERCQQDGANLVTILNEQMSQFITDQVSWDVGFMHLLGLNDKRGIDQYRWLDFIEPINFTKWATLYPEPNDPEGLFKCAFIMLQEFYERGYWAVSRCDDLAKTICEKFADCSKESYGMLCPKECQHCKESPLSPPCNPRFGLCYYGSAECPLGTYGPNCGNRCNVSCGGADNACSVADGSCLNGCDTGYAGKSCDERAREKTQSASSSTFPVWIVIVIPCVTMLIVTV